MCFLGNASADRKKLQEKSVWSHNPSVTLDVWYPDLEVHCTYDYIKGSLTVKKLFGFV